MVLGVSLIGCGGRENVSFVILFLNCRGPLLLSISLLLSRLLVLSGLGLEVGLRGGFGGSRIVVLRGLGLGCGRGLGG